MTNMLNHLKQQVSQNKMLFVALVISTLLHIFWLAEFSLSLPSSDENIQTLAMRLVATEQPQPATTPHASSKPPLNQPQQQIQPDKPPAIDRVPEASPETTLSSANPIENAQNIADETIKISDVPAEDQPNIPATDEPETPQPYTYVATEFEVRRGNDQSAAGTALVTFKINDNSTYSISSTVEAKGLASLFFNTLKQTSEGVVTEAGLRPNYYRYQYGDDEKKAQSANFAWSDGVVEMTSAKGTKTENLRSGTQDFLSFMYQFMFTAPLANMEITMTNGKKLRTYTYSFEGDELVKTKLGELKAVHLVKAGEDEEKTEIWLAVDYKFLPIKIRKTEKDGNVIEQTISKLNTSLD